MTVRVVGLDLSITATGIAWADGSTFTVKSKQVGDSRLLAICHEIGIAIDGRSIDLVVIEDLPTHAMSAGITGMVHGAARTYLLRLRAPYVTMPPATLKKFATGRGNADKTAMAIALLKRAGIELADDNQVDAWWLRAAGMQMLGEPVVDLPAAQVAALDKLRPAVTA